MDRSHFLSNGEVKRESRTVDGEVFSMAYDYSFCSRLRAYVDVLGQTQLYDFDDVGRLEKTTLHAPEPKRTRYRLQRAPAGQLLLESTFGYDRQGRMASITTTDASTGNALAILLEYDEFDREILRTFDFGDTLQTLAQDYDEFDCLKSRILKERPKGSDESQATLLRHETYQYDRRGRLQIYTCDGPEAPVDPSGQTIARQIFGFDGLDNILSVITYRPDGTWQRTLYEFKNSDPAQMSRIIPPDALLETYDVDHDLEELFKIVKYDPQLAIDLHYDGNGNLISDEQGRVLTYDGLNRLLRVETPDGERCRYNYDPENILSGTAPG
ncbi:RHS repeat protein [Pseudomonas sp. Ap32]|nr:RHS repeat protein [Pseudomonas sp. Ap32]